MSSWHLDADVALDYVRGTADPALAAEVEAHLIGCADCQNLVGAAVPEERLAGIWRNITSGIDKPHPPALQRVLTHPYSDRLRPGAGRAWTDGGRRSPPAAVAALGGQSSRSAWVLPPGPALALVGAILAALMAVAWLTTSSSPPLPPLGEGHEPEFAVCTNQASLLFH
jgi:hypothetical protein